MVVAVLLIAGLQVPLIPLLEVPGKVIAVPLQYGPSWVNKGVSIGCGVIKISCMIFTAQQGFLKALMIFTVESPVTLCSVIAALPELLVTTVSSIN
ncbi:hypothetical protein D3C80_1275990 [compost metagenome]